MNVTYFSVVVHVLRLKKEKEKQILIYKRLLFLSFSIPGQYLYRKRALKVGNRFQALKCIKNYDDREQLSFSLTAVHLFIILTAVKAKFDCFL